MLFNSVEFLIFFPVVTLLFFLLPHKWRWLHLLLSSCFFYMAFIPVYIFILFFTIIIDYIAGIAIESAQGRKRKLFLAMSIVANVGVLAYFKYYNFFIDNVDGVLANLHLTRYALPLLKIILPIGLSFHTFQAMSYTIEVYRKHQKAERHFGIYALYVMFYPQLVAGPIERPQNLLHQFYEEHHFDYDRITSGFKLMMWGMFKKVVIADRLALFTDPVFNHAHDYPAVTLLTGAFFFSFQIFCDFSGYSDIAIGAARVMGFKLMTNFNKPYHARSIAEFWKRWHISLSTWFRDYLYISIGGNRVSIPRWYFNLFFVFLVSGFWHGANWTFVVWGALHGFYLIFAIVSGKWRQTLRNLTGISRVKWLDNTVQVTITFFLVMMAWIFFRANTFTDALYIIGQVPAGFKQLFTGLITGHIWLGAGDVFSHWKLPFALILLLEIIHLVQTRVSIEDILKAKPVYLRWFAYYLCIAIMWYFGVFQNRQFIYFQF